MTRPSDGINMSTRLLPREVQGIRDAIGVAMSAPDLQRPGKDIGSAVTAVYAFKDYDGEPIYVGQTRESVRTRVGRHLTGQRSDAVAKYVLDPFEVHMLLVWSLPAVLSDFPTRQQKAVLDEYEFTVYHELLSGSDYQAVLNEGGIQPVALRSLPPAFEAVIVPNNIFPDRSHPDVRIARRAQTISLLAKNISERKVSPGLRRTLVTQTHRLDVLARRRAAALGIGLTSVDMLPGDEADDE